MFELTELQRQELTKSEPLAVDPQTNEHYVLVRKEIYDRFKRSLFDEGPDMRQVAVLVDMAMNEYDQNDPTLAYYQEKFGRTTQATSSSIPTVPMESHRD